MNRADYVDIVKRLVQEWAEYVSGAKTSSGERLNSVPVFDDERGHYLAVTWCWDKGHYSHHADLHLEVRGDKIWVHHDDTKDGIVDELLEAGVPYKHIVMGWHPPDVRQHTPFAVD
jgi:XisI protein